MHFVKNVRIAFVVLCLSVLPFLSASPASTKKEITADSIIDKMVENAAKIKTLEAQLSSVDASTQKSEGFILRFKRPARFRIDVPDGPIQPRIITIMDGKNVISWMPEQKLLNTDPQKAVLHPAFILTLDPEKIRSCSSNVELRTTAAKPDEHVIDITVAENPVLSRTLYDTMAIRVSKTSHTITGIEITDAQGRVSICSPTSFHKIAGAAEIPVSWRNTIPESLFFAEFTLTDVKVDREIPDETFKHKIPKDALVIDGKPKTEGEYRQAIKANPDDASARYNYGLLFAGRNDHAAAKTQFEKLAQLRPDSLPVKIMLASALAVTGESEKAVSICDNVIKMRSITPAMRAQTADVYSLAGRNDTALEQCRRIIELYPKDPVGYQKAFLLVRENPAEAKRLIQRYLTAANHDITSRYVALNLNSMLKKPEYMAAVTDSLIEDEDLNAWMALQLAKVFWNMKNYNTTTKFYEKAIQLEPEYLPAYMALNDIYGRLKQTEKQAALAEKLAGTGSQDPAVISSVASIYVAAGEQREAIKYLEHGLDILPFSQEIYYNLAQLYLKAGEIEKLGTLMKSLMVNCPPDARTYFTAGAIYEDINDLDNAKASYQKAVLFGNLDTFQYSRILRFYISNNMEANTELVADTIVRTSEDPHQLFLAANAFLQLRKADKSLEAATAAVNMAKDPSALWTYRLFAAQLHFQKNEKDKAEAILRELVKQKHIAPEPEMHNNAQLLLSQIIQDQELSGSELERYIDDLVKRMQQPDLRNQDIQDIKSALTKTGKAATGKLLELLDTAKPHTRRLAIEILGDIGDPAAAPAIRKLLDDEDPRTVLETVRALGKIKDSESSDKIIDILREHEEPAIRAQAAEALGEIGDARAVDHLIEALKSDPEKRTLFSITQALAELNDEKAIKPLLDALENEKGMSVKTWIAEALARFDQDKGYDFLVHTITDENKTEIEIKEAILGVINIPGERSFGILQDCFRNPNPLIRKYAAIGAHQKTDSDVMPLLIKALNDDAAEVRYGAIISMGNLGDKNAIAPLKKRRQIEENEELVQFIDQALGILNAIE